MAKLDDILKDVFNVNPSDYTDDTELSQLKEWDSMAHMLLITQFEDTYNIQLNGDQIALMRKVGDFRQEIKKHGISE